jgi:hypothetical protein
MVISSQSPDAHRDRSCVAVDEPVQASTVSNCPQIVALL